MQKMLTGDKGEAVGRSFLEGGLQSGHACDHLILDHKITCDHIPEDRIDILRTCIENHGKVALVVTVMKESTSEKATSRKLSSCMLIKLSRLRVRCSRGTNIHRYRSNCL